MPVYLNFLNPPPSCPLQKQISAVTKSVGCRLDFLGSNLALLLTRINFGEVPLYLKTGIHGKGVLNSKSITTSSSVPKGKAETWISPSLRPAPPLSPWIRKFANEPTLTQSFLLPLLLGDPKTCHYHLESMTHKLPSLPFLNSISLTSSKTHSGTSDSANSCVSLRVSLSSCLTLWFHHACETGAARAGCAHTLGTDATAPETQMSFHVMLTLHPPGELGRVP